MTKFLASVRDRTEALTALDNGADIIDVKEPGKGALGAAAPEVVAGIVAAVAGRAPVSAVAGDLPMEPGPVLAAVMARAGADFVKVGFFPAGADAWRVVCAALAAGAPQVRRVAVLFADDRPDLGFLDHLRQTGFAGVMLDTRRKDGRRLLDHMPPQALADFVAATARHGLMSGLAGALEAPDVPRLLPLSPDYLGFRGALSERGRGGALSGARVARIAALVHPAAPARDGVQGRLDRVFMRDFVQEMEIGAYGFERGRRQRVRFTVEAGVHRAGRTPRDMADVLSYDVMMDAVRALVARGHTELVETLAEELATSILADPRVEEVMVRVEKLDLGPAAAGIEIHRRRMGNAALQQ